MCYNTQGYDDNKTLQEFDAEAISDNITRQYSQVDYSKDLMSVFDEDVMKLCEEYKRLKDYENVTSAIQDRLEDTQSNE